MWNSHLLPPGGGGAGEAWWGGVDPAGRFSASGPGIPFIPLALQVGNFTSQKLGSRKCVLRKVLMGQEEPILPRGDLGDLLCV